uniref:Uncharacterized protein n=1 Tax=Cannabis sativa TaxID=3483 RepID=A0A803QAD5_CANSA
MRLDLGNCSRLKSFPQLLEPMEKLEIIILNGTGIEEMSSSSIENLIVLETLSLNECKNLMCIPTTICKLKSLGELDLGGCSELKSIPEILEPMAKLKKLYLKGSGIEEMSSSIENLVVLEELNLSECKNLKSIPTTICKLKSLMSLNLDNCSKLKSFPEILEPMKELWYLPLNGSGIEEIPSSIENLVMLNNLNLRECKNLKSIPTSIFNMGSISEIEIDKYPQLQILPYNFLPVEDSSETSTSQLLVTHDQPYICSSCTSTAILNLHYDGVDFTCCQCFLFYTIHNILATQYFINNCIFVGKCMNGKEKDFRTSFCYSGGTITPWFGYQSMGSSLELNLPFRENCYDFLGFGLCIVVEFDPTILKDDDVLDLKCEYNLKTKKGVLTRLRYTS